ncbi:MAG: hypothetical protein SGJ24_17440 [Chloroflexota bacterium]|nr:hypothetical protein [Chloroflexota bacterium]
MRRVTITVRQAQDRALASLLHHPHTNSTEPDDPVWDVEFLFS